MGVETKVGRVHLEAGKGYEVVVEYQRMNRNGAALQAGLEQDRIAAWIRRLWKLRRMRM